MKIGYSMPSAAPLFPEPPFVCKDNKVIRIVFRTSAEILRELVPEPLLPNPDQLAFIYIDDIHIVAPVKINYLEVGIGIPALFDGALGYYFAFLYLDSPLAIITGREIWGWPKKEAEITFTEKDKLFKASVRREGVSLVQASVNTTEQVVPIPSQPDSPAFNLKLIPSVKRNHPPEVLQLTSTITTSEKKVFFRGDAKLSFTSSGTDPLGRIPILEILSGEQYIEDMTLDCGDVLYDYLSENKK
jgi:acetoacetate decarboxylase